MNGFFTQALIARVGTTGIENTGKLKTLADIFKFFADKLGGEIGVLLRVSAALANQIGIVLNKRYLKELSQLAQTTEDMNFIIKNVALKVLEISPNLGKSKEEAESQANADLKKLCRQIFQGKLLPFRNDQESLI